MESARPGKIQWDVRRTAVLHALFI